MGAYRDVFTPDRIVVPELAFMEKNNSCSTMEESMYPDWDNLVSLWNHD